MPSCLAAVLVAGAADAAPSLAIEPSAAAPVIVVQVAFGVLYGFAAGFATRRVWRSQLTRHAPWHDLVSVGQGQHVVVCTSSSKRYCGWIRQASSDDEAGREVILGDPKRLSKKGFVFDMGSEMLFCDNEIVRIAKAKFKDGASAQSGGRRMRILAVARDGQRNMGNAADARIHVRAYAWPARAGEWPACTACNRASALRYRAGPHTRLAVGAGACRIPARRAPPEARAHAMPPH